MGDRCYMSVTCRRQDRDRFEKLGFVLEFEQSPDSLVIEMADQEANYALAGQLPTNIPYTAWNGAGSNYGDGKMACDGKQYAEVSAHQDGFVLDWDYEKMRPEPKSVQRVRHYIAIYQRAGQILSKLRQKEPHKHVFSPHTNLCYYCGIHAKR
jgi:hypothetical protein